MKRLILIAAVAILSRSAFAQGYFNFTSATRAVWDGWSTVATGLPKADASNNVAFFINWNNTGSPAVAAIQSYTPTNGTEIPSATAWDAILNDPNFHFATNATTGQMVISQTSAAGGINYNSSASFPVVGTSSTGGTIDVYVIAWSYMYANPFLAAAAGAPVGWSQEFNYTYGTQIATVQNFSVQGMLPFGVTVPEPTVFALASIGAMGWILSRRQKK